MFRNSLLFVMMTLLVVCNGNCTQVETGWFESQNVLGNEAFAISFPGVPELSEASKKRKFEDELTLSYSNDDSKYILKVSSHQMSKELRRQELKNRLKNFALQDFIAESSIVDLHFYDDQEMSILEATIYKSLGFRHYKIIFTESNIYQLVAKNYGTKLDYSQFVNSFRVFEKTSE